MNYKQKYFKYKNKYFYLKNIIQYGGLFNIGDKVYINGKINYITQIEFDTKKFGSQKITEIYVKNLEGTIVGHKEGMILRSHKNKNPSKYNIYLDNNKYAIDVPFDKISKDKLIDYNIGDIVYFSGPIKINDYSAIENAQNLKATIVNKLEDFINPPKYEINIHIHDSFDHDFEHKSVPSELIILIHDLKSLSNKINSIYNIGDNVIEMFDYLKKNPMIVKKIYPSVIHQSKLDYKIKPVNYLCQSTNLHKLDYVILNEHNLLSFY
jgi:hypothetical protein